MAGVAEAMRIHCASRGAIDVIGAVGATYCPNRALDLA